MSAKLISGEATDVITDVRCEDSRVYISVSDGSLIQFGGVSQKSIALIEQEKPLLIGASILIVFHNKEDGRFSMDYKTNTGRLRFLKFDYDPVEQKEYEKSLENTN